MPVSTREVIVDKHSNMVIAAKANTRYAVGSPVYMDDANEAASLYGEGSDIVEAFKVAQGLGVKDIFLMNTLKHQDLLNAHDVFDQNDFAYVVPIGYKFSDTFVDITNGSERTNYYAYLLNHANIRSKTVYVVTDHHASLYEDLDSFISDMDYAEKLFLWNCFTETNRRNLIFCANNLENTEHANLYLAAALCTTDAAEYPTADFGPAVFNIDSWDTTKSWAYFKNHELAPTTVENLLNMADSHTPGKIVTVNRIINIIEREMDFSEFLGQNYTAYKEILIRQKLNRYLGGLLGYLLYDYKIDSIQAYKGMPGTVTVLCRYTICPKGTIETISLEKEVVIG